MDKQALTLLAFALRRSLADVGIPVDGVILFGSYARGQQRPDSDIDLAILSRSFGQDRFREGSLVNLHAHRLNAAIEAVPIGLSEWFGRNSVSPLVHEIRRDGQFLL